LQLKTFSLLKQPAVAITSSLSNSSPQVNGNALLVLLALTILLSLAARVEVLGLVERLMEAVAGRVVLEQVLVYQ
jgi:hypothetical protein